MTQRDQWYLISYDIREPRRLGRLHRYLKRHCFMLQESVYLFTGNKPAWQTLKTDIEKRIKKREDDVRVYVLNSDCCLNFYGSSPWPQGVYFGGYPAFTITPLPENTDS